MLRRIILAIIVLGAAGLVVGYLIFARTTNGYLSLKSLVTPAGPGNVIGELVKYRAGRPPDPAEHPDLRGGGRRHRPGGRRGGRGGRRRRR